MEQKQVCKKERENVEMEREELQEKQVYIVVSEQKENGEREVLGAFSEKETAKRRAAEYAVEQEEECWVVEAKENVWEYETGEKGCWVHKTWVHKTTNQMTHLIEYTKETCFLIEEGEEWYRICQTNASEDAKGGLEQNLRLLEAYKAGKAAKTA